MQKNLFSLLMLVIVLISACKPFDLSNNQGTPLVEEKTMSELSVPDGFHYATAHNVNLLVAAVDNQKKTMVNIPFRVLIQDEPGSDLVLLFNGRTDDQGNFSMARNLPISATKLVIQTDYPGLPSASVDLNGQNTIAVTLGDGNGVKDRSGHSKENPSQYSKSAASDRSTGFDYLGTFDSDGVPNYLMPQGDIVSQDILNMITATLPEGQPVPTYHPEYITNSVETNTVLDDSAAVWVTFVHEGAGYRNSLGYYAYPTGQTPQTAAAIGSLKVIFPNVSYPGSGGNLHTGDKVFLGNFSAGTTLGWFLVPDGWQSGTSTVSDINHPVRFSNKQLNTFTSAPYQSHVVQLVDPNRELLLLGFEDLDRPGGDNDFNDAVFYTTVTPFTALNRSGMAETKIAGTDSDGDGVPDNTDEAPNDPTYAFKGFTPSKTGVGSLAFEDVFPMKGDYDLNDLVLDYQFEEHLNAANKIVSITANLTIRALGASFRNGFGIELPVSPDQVASVTGAKITDHIISLSANGTEAGQSKAVIIPFDNAYNIMVPPGTTSFVNTEVGQPVVSPVQLQVVITFNEPISRADLGTAPYNPFVIVNRERGREVHLPGSMPTDLANTALFGTEDDDSSLSTGKTYLTKNNLPWAIDIPESFNYPTEKAPINQAYLNFNKWVESGGAQFPDWYKKKSGNRADTKIYH
jgi:LruC domain-containing protein